MKSSDLIIIQQPKSQDKLDALKAFLKALKIKFEIASENEIPIEHQNLVLERIKNSKEEDLLNWDDVKDDFDGI
jgi:exoribonuclease R